jgi:hypothetical protein
VRLALHHRVQRPPQRPIVRSARTCGQRSRPHGSAPAPGARVPLRRTCDADQVALWVGEVTDHKVPTGFFRYLPCPLTSPVPPESLAPLAFRQTRPGCLDLQYGGGLPTQIAAWRLRKRRGNPQSQWVTPPGGHTSCATDGSHPPPLPGKAAAARPRLPPVCRTQGRTRVVDPRQGIRAHLRYSLTAPSASRLGRWPPDASDRPAEVGYTSGPDEGYPLGLRVGVSESARATHNLSG